MQNTIIHRIPQSPLKQELDEPPTIEKISGAIELLKSSKTTRVDGIQSDVWKYSGPTVHCRHPIRCLEVHRSDCPLSASNQMSGSTSVRLSTVGIQSDVWKYSGPTVHCRHPIRCLEVHRSDCPLRASRHLGPVRLSTKSFTTFRSADGNRSSCHKVFMTPSSKPNTRPRVISPTVH